MLQDFLSSRACSLLALELCVPAHCLNSCCATGGAQLLTCPQGQDHRAVRMSREGRIGFPGGWWSQTKAAAPSSAPARGCSATRGTWAISHSPAVPQCIWPSGLLSVLPFPLCLSPLSVVDNGVNEAGGDRSGCCRVAHSRCGGKCAHPSVSCSCAISGALDPPSSFTGPHFSGAVPNSLAPLCHLFLEVTCSMGCQQVVLYLH